jgi:CcmD family protein
VWWLVDASQLLGRSDHTWLSAAFGIVWLALGSCVAVVGRRLARASRET